MSKILIDKDYCYACNSPIKDSISRGFMVQTSEDEGFKINLHYFPPCSTVKLPEEWKVFGAILRYPLDYIVGGHLFHRKPKYPNIRKQLHEIDKTQEVVVPYYITKFGKKDGTTIEEIYPV